MTIELPALNGNDSLGFLAALGLVALSEQGEIGRLRLGWRGRAAPIAIVEGPSSIESLAQELKDAFVRLRATGGVVPGSPTDFPIAGVGSGPDPMRMSQAEMHRFYCLAEEAGKRWRDYWLIALAGQVTVKDEKRGDIVLTRFYAPTGQMKLRNSLFNRTMDAVERVRGPGDALAGWRRTTYDGANFDERAIRDAAVTTNGEPENLGAPSPTWLATMAFPFFPIVDDGFRVAVPCWHEVSLYPGFTRRSLIWPVWTPLLDGHAIRVLLCHEGIAVVESERHVVAPEKPRLLDALGVVGLFGASRRTLTQGDGPLGPTVRLWPRA